MLYDDKPLNTIPMPKVKTPRDDFLDAEEAYKATNDKRYWKELIRLLPEGWLQKRTTTLNYQVLRQMYFDRRYHRLTEWSKSFVEWVKTLPYAEELIMYEGDDKNA